MPSRRGFAKLTTDDGADSDGTEIIEDDSGSASPGVDRGAFGEMFALAQSVGADDAEVEESRFVAAQTSKRS